MLRENLIIQTLSNHKLKFYSEDSLELKYQKSLNKKELDNLVVSLSSELNLSFLLNFENDDDRVLRMPEDLEDLNEIFLSLLPDTIKIYITIKKANIVEQNDTVNFLIFYNLENLENHLKKVDLFEISNYLFSTKNKCWIWIINDSVPENNNDCYIKLANIEDKFDENNFNVEDNTNKIAKYKKLSSGIYTSISITPEHFNSPFNHGISNILNKWRTILSICYLCSYSEIINHESVFHFQGSKKVKLYFDLNSTVSENNIFELYDWIYQEKTEDKIKLFHNLLSTLFISTEELKFDDFLNLIPNITNTTQENFNFFIQDNIKTFIEERKKIEDLVTQTSNQISNEINKITSYFVKILTGTFISVLTTLLALIFRVENMNYIAYALYLLAAIILLGSIYITIISFVGIKISKNLFNNRMEEYQYLFNNDKFTKLKTTVKNRIHLFNWIVVINSIITFALIVTIFCLGTYFKTGQNNWIQFLLNNLEYIV